MEKPTKKRIAKYDPVSMQKYRDSKAKTTSTIKIDLVNKDIADKFKNLAKELGLSQRELFEKTFK